MEFNEETGEQIFEAEEELDEDFWPMSIFDVMDIEDIYPY